MGLGNFFWYGFPGHRNVKIYGMTKFLGVLFTCLISFTAVFNDVLMKSTSSVFSSWEICALRSFFSIITLCVVSFFIYLFKGHDKKLFLKNEIILPISKTFKSYHVIRNIVTLLAIVIVTYCLKFCQINQVDIITYTIPILHAMIDGVLFKERISLFSIFLAFICIIACTQVSTWSNALLLILSGFLFAFAEVWIKRVMVQKCDLKEMVLSSGITTCMILSYYLYGALGKINMTNIFFLIFLGVGDWAILFFIKEATSNPIFKYLTPLRYLNIVLSLMADNLFFHYCHPNWIAILTIITTSILSVLVMKKEKKRIL